MLYYLLAPLGKKYLLFNLINYLSFRASTGFSGEPRPDPGEPIGFPLVAVPTPTPGPLTEPSLF